MHPQSVLPDGPTSTDSGSRPRNWRFWGIIFAICVTNFTSSLDLSISTALPVIAHDLRSSGSSDFVWVGSAYALASTAFLPMSGGLAQAFGRRSVLFGAILLFALGSALAGAARNMDILIVARTLQGVGAGGIMSLNQIVLSDLVPLKERGSFNGLLGLASMVAVCAAPVIAGGLADRGAWRWLFYMNLFTSALSGNLVLFLLSLKTPQGKLRDKLAQLDWIGNFLVIAASSSTVIALTWAGIRYPWTSKHVLPPLVIGLAGMCGLFLYDYFLERHPIVPFSLMTSRTAISGYVQTFIVSILLFLLVYYLPVYFQACKGASPTQSGVNAFGLSFSVPLIGVLGGASVVRWQSYRLQIWAAWAFIVAALGGMSSLKSNTALSASIGYQILAGSGLGILTTTTYFPVLAPLPVSANAQALSFFMFSRSFGQIWGITIGATIIQNQLKHRLPSSFSREFPEGTAIAYETIPLLRELAPELRDQIQDAFAGSLSVLWQVALGIGAIGLMCSLAMKALPLHGTTDDSWAIDDRCGREELGIP